MKIGQFVEYKGYVGSIEYKPDDISYYGLIINTSDFVNYYGKGIFELEKEFHNAVDDYLIFCEEVGKSTIVY